MNEENKSNLNNQGQSNGAGVVNSAVTQTAGQGEKLDAVAVHKDDSSSQEISQIKLSNGEVVTEQEAVQLAEQHKVNLVAAKSRSGQEYVRSYPDGDPNNNLKNLPEF